MSIYIIIINRYIYNVKTSEISHIIYIYHVHQKLNTNTVPISFVASLL